MTGKCNCDVYITGVLFSLKKKVKFGCLQQDRWM